jgi:uncharacterized ferritin-like protein (DUF455 family)
MCTHLVGTSKFSVHSTLTLKDAAIIVLSCKDLYQKAALTFLYALYWSDGIINIVSDNFSDTIRVPNAPGRPDSAKSVNRPAVGKNAVELTIHGIAHAESYAIDLFWDLIARYVHEKLPKSFYDEAVAIAGMKAPCLLLVCIYG